MSKPMHFQKSHRSNIPKFQSLFSFSYDLRGRAPNQAQHWADSHVLGNRANFYLSRPVDQWENNGLLTRNPGDKRRPIEDRLPVGTSVLTIRRISTQDRGLYRCRVDFHAAPTRNSMANLTVVGKCWEENLLHWGVDIDSGRCAQRPVVFSRPFLWSAFSWMRDTKCTLKLSNVISFCTFWFWPFKFGVARVLAFRQVVRCFNENSVFSPSCCSTSLWAAWNSVGLGF